MTSNPLLARLRGDNCHCRMATEAADEIERLATALAGTKDELHSVDKAAKELGEERDSLRGVLMEAEAIYMGSGTVVDRLHGMLRIVRQALAGVAHEPTEGHSSGVLNAALSKDADCDHSQRTADETFDPLASKDHDLARQESETSAAQKASFSAAGKASYCPATWQPVIGGPEVRCVLPAGHDGKHLAEPV